MADNEGFDLGSAWDTLRGLGSGAKDFVADGADAMGDAMELIAAINDPEKRAKLLSEEGAIKGWGMIAAAIIGAWKFGPIKGGLLGMATGKLLGDLIEWVVGFFKGKMGEEVMTQFTTSAAGTNPEPKPEITTPGLELGLADGPE